MLGRKSLAVVALTGALSLTAACGGGGNGGGGSSTTGANGKGPLKLGYVLPQTGQLAYLGPPQIEAAKYAAKTINDAGGVRGQKIPALVGADESDQAATANQSADRVLSSGVKAVIGAAASGMSLAIIDKITGAHVVQCSGSNTAPTFTTYKDGGYYIRTAPSDALQGPVLADTIVADGHTKVAITARADDYGKGLEQATAKALKQAGAQVVLTDTYDPQTKDFSTVAQKVADTKPDAAVVIAFEEGSQIIKNLIESGAGPDKIGVYGADGLRSEELGKLVDKKNPGIISGMKGTAPASAKNEKFTSALKDYAPKLKEMQFAPQVFDCVNVIALAAEEAKSTDPSVFKDHLVDVTEGGTKCTSYADCKKAVDAGKDIDYDGASGPVDFTKVGEPNTAQIEVYGYNKSGELHTLKTVTSKPSG